jgi:hypothetical protein
VIHDRDGIFSPGVDQALKGFGVRVLKTPVRAPQANAFCERLVGTLRRECLDFLIPINERHVKIIVREFATHYNRGRPHSSLGPGIPEPSENSVPAEAIGTCCPPVTASTQSRFSLDCIMNTDWKRRPLNARPNFCGRQGGAAQADQTIAYSEVRSVSQMKAHKARTVLILVALGVGIAFAFAAFTVHG